MAGREPHFFDIDTGKIACLDLHVVDDRMPPDKRPIVVTTDSEAPNLCEICKKAITRRRAKAS